MNDCYRCEAEKQCYYPFKVCDCVGQRKFWTIQQRQSYDADQAEKLAKMPTLTTKQYDAIVSCGVVKSE